MGDLATELLLITLSIISLVVTFFGAYWVWRRFFTQKIKYRVYIDDGVRLRACSAEPIEMFEKDGETWLRLKTRCFEHDVIVPRNSFRILYSRVWGSFLAYLVDSKGTPKAWGTDQLIKALDYETYRKIIQETAYMKILAGILRYDVVKLMAIVVIAALIVVAIALFFQPAPQVIVVNKIVNKTVSHTLTNTTIPPPPPPR